LPTQLSRRVLIAAHFNVNDVTLVAYLCRRRVRCSRADKCSRSARPDRDTHRGWDKDYWGTRWSLERENIN